MIEENPKSDKWANAGEAYSDEFLAELGVEFEFDALAPKMAQEIRGIGVRYFADIRIFRDDPDREERREEYCRLKRLTADFSELLTQPEYGEVASDLFDAALRLREPPPQTNFPELSEFEKTRGAPYLAELQRLLRLLAEAAEYGVRAYSPQRGRKRNYVVENFARRAAYVWAHMLKRPYTIDYHQGSGVTRAFDFVRTLLNKIDPDVSDTAIVTGMRIAVAELRGLESRRKVTSRKF